MLISRIYYLLLFVFFHWLPVMTTMLVSSSGSWHTGQRWNLLQTCFVFFLLCLTLSHLCLHLLFLLISHFWTFTSGTGITLIHLWRSATIHSRSLERDA